MFFYKGNKEMNQHGTYIYLEDSQNLIEGCLGFSMNTQYIFFWSKSLIYQMNLKDDHQLEMLDIEVSTHSESTMFHDVRTCCNKDMIYIRI